jgi:membrane fusion protein, copper/silver efflux system
MKPAPVVLVTLLVAAGVGGGYWWGQRSERTEAASAAAGQPAGATKNERRILYYRNPMGLPDTSPVPKKDPMGMDYVPVYEGEPPAENTPVNQVAISVDKVQKLGVRSEPASMRALDSAVRVSGRVEVDERRVYSITPKFEGWVERLLVNATGQAVSRGQPLLEVYSPELVSAQREYAIAAEGVRELANAGSEAQASMQRLAESSLVRLRNWDISDEQLQRLRASGEFRRTLTFRSPVSGIVMEKKALQGMRFMPGDALYQIADLSSVWVIADIYERDIGNVRRGAKATLAFAAYPGETFQGAITYVYPTLTPETRTVPVRIELANPRQRIKPNMFAQVEIATAEQGKLLVIPASAVIDSGERQVVLVELGEGKFQPRPVRLGARSSDYVQVLEGVSEGERVVVSANFLIDAESNLKAAISSFGHGDQGAAGTGAAPGPDASVRGTGGSVGHSGNGTVEAIDPKSGTVSLAHGPIGTLKWPAMTMDFQVANRGLLQGMTPGTSVTFEFVERKPGEYVITKLAPARAASASAPPAGTRSTPPASAAPGSSSANTHKGH